MSPSQIINDEASRLSGLKVGDIFYIVDYNYKEDQDMVKERTVIGFGFEPSRNHYRVLYKIKNATNVLSENIDNIYTTLDSAQDACKKKNIVALKDKRERRVEKLVDLQKEVDDIDKELLKLEKISVKLTEF